MIFSASHRAPPPTNRGLFGTIQSRRWLVVVCCALVLGTSWVRAKAAHKELLSINMRDADIGAVIQWIAEKTHKQIVIDPRVKGKITVLANQPMTIDQAYQVFLAALDVYGYGATESGGILRIFPEAMAKVSPARIVKNYRDLHGSEQMVYVYKAANVSADRLKQLVAPLIPTSGYLESFPDSNSLVIGDDASNIKRILRLIQQVDSSGNFNIQAVRLQHASADKVADLVASLLTPDDNKNFAVSSDQRSNSVLLSGDPAIRRRVMRLIHQLDQPISEAGMTRVVHLNYLSAQEVLPILKGLSQSVKKTDKNANTAAVPISIESSKSANAIVMTAPPGMLDLMEKVIHDIDIRRRQVLVEAIIVEVSQDFSESLGVEWNTNFAADNNVEAATSFGLRSGSTGSTSGATALSDLLGKGLSLGFYRNGSLRALMQALANDSGANILSTPSIVTLDNQEAEIMVGSNVPFITGQVTSGGSSTVNPFTTIERQDIGLKLKITPKINQDNSVTLDVNQELQSIANSSATTIAGDIITNKRSIKTKVLVQNGTILVLGGLISDEQQNVVNKVPFLGDIPLIGRLFKSTTEKRTKKNLMVFIHPVIIGAGDTSNRATRAKYDYIRKLQKQYGSGIPNLGRDSLKDFDTYRPRPPDAQQHKP